ncbi:hypothetical protein HJFPF1_10004 [Paramyrothecium foliicola]|nr:hypothetical protein HJFPF1_10004 [Paramyrothecium foliicola]
MENPLLNWLLSIVFFASVVGGISLVSIAINLATSLLTYVSEETVIPSRQAIQSWITSPFIWAFQHLIDRPIAQASYFVIHVTGGDLSNMDTSHHHLATTLFWFFLGMFIFSLIRRAVKRLFAYLVRLLLALNSEIRRAIEIMAWRWLREYSGPVVVLLIISPFCYSIGYVSIEWLLMCNFAYFLLAHYLLAVKQLSSLAASLVHPDETSLLHSTKQEQQSTTSPAEEIERPHSPTMPPPEPHSSTTIPPGRKPSDAAYVVPRDRSSPPKPLIVKPDAEAMPELQILVKTQPSPADELDHGPILGQRRRTSRFALCMKPADKCWKNERDIQALRDLSKKREDEVLAFKARVLAEMEQRVLEKDTEIKRLEDLWRMERLEKEHAEAWARLQDFQSENSSPPRQEEETRTLVPYKGKEPAISENVVAELQKVQADLQDALIREQNNVAKLEQKVTDSQNLVDLFRQQREQVEEKRRSDLADKDITIQHMRNQLEAEKGRSAQLDEQLKVKQSKKKKKSSSKKEGKRSNETSASATGTSAQIEVGGQSLGIPHVPQSEDGTLASTLTAADNTNSTPKTAPANRSAYPLTPANGPQDNKNPSADSSLSEKLARKQRQQARLERDQARREKLLQTLVTGSTATQQRVKDTTESKHEQGHSQGEISTAQPGQSPDSTVQPAGELECVATQPATSMQNSTNLQHGVNPELMVYNQPQPHYVPQPDELVKPDELDRMLDEILGSETQGPQLEQQATAVTQLAPPAPVIPQLEQQATICPRLEPHELDEMMQMLLEADRLEAMLEHVPMPDNTLPEQMPQAEQQQLVEPGTREKTSDTLNAKLRRAIAAQEGNAAGGPPMVQPATPRRGRGSPKQNTSPTSTPKKTIVKKPNKPIGRARQGAVKRGDSCTRADKLLRMEQFWA